MRTLVVVLALLGAGTLVAVEIPSQCPTQSCEEVTLSHPLRVYKDPALYPSSPGLMDVDPSTGLEMAHEETPLLSTFTGTFHYQCMAIARGFRDFNTLERLYDLKAKGARQNGKAKRQGNGVGDDRVMQIRICGENEPYSGTLGFFFLKDLERAQAEDLNSGQLPPSVYPNPIPQLKEYSQSEGRSRNSR